MYVVLKGGHMENIVTSGIQHFEENIRDYVPMVSGNPVTKMYAEFHIMDDISEYVDKAIKEKCTEDERKNFCRIQRTKLCNKILEEVIAYGVIVGLIK